ncbi:MAG: hypothetical protein H7Y15_08550 [Pseudonocardia sp.]|nr:hypothetical protein [Pseudonocardia sp.]
MLEAIIATGVPVLIGLGVGIGRLTITAQQRIVRIRQERHRWLLHTWQRDLEANEGCCIRCRTN